MIGFVVGMAMTAINLAVFWGQFTPAAIASTFFCLTVGIGSLLWEMSQ